MNIVLLHYAAPPVVGGVETVLARQAQLLARAGHQVRIVAGRGQTWDAQIPVEVYPLVDSRHPKVLKAKASLDEGQIPPNFEKLVEQIQAELTPAIRDADAVIAHNVASLHKNLALTAALFNISQGTPAPRTILWHHDLAWTTTRYQPELHPGWPWDLLSSAWPNVRQVTISTARREELSELIGLPLWEITVVPAGLDICDFLKLSTRTQALMEHMQLSMAAPILLTPVRITRRKNIEQAIAVTAELRKDMPEATLIVTGPPGPHNPSNRQYFKQLLQMRKELKLKKAVHLLGESHSEGLPEEIVTDLYRVADALFLPSREEGFGIPILEAGLSRMPIFCSNIPQLRALAGEFGSYFSPDDDPNLVAKMIVQRLRGDPIYQMRVKVRKEYTWDAVYLNKIAPLLET